MVVVVPQEHLGQQERQERQERVVQVEVVVRQVLQEPQVPLERQVLVVLGLIQYKHPH